VSRQVAVIVATSVTSAALAAKSKTARIPIVFTTGADPVEIGLVASLNRPGGNLTGISFLTTSLAAKRLEFLHELVPAATVIGNLVNPTNPQASAERKETEAAAHILGLRLMTFNASTPDEIEAVFANLSEPRIGALLIGSDPLFGGVYGPQIATLAMQRAIPSIFNTGEVVRRAGLMSYGANIGEAIRLAGNYTGRILKGEKPADLPVQQATKVELVLNMKTAKALGLTFPLTLLGLADEVIE